MGEINGRICKEKYNWISILLYPISISSIIILKIYAKKLKKTNLVRWSTQGGDLKNKFTTKVEIFLPELDVTKSVMWYFHLDDLQGHHMYDMILGLDIFSGLNMDLCLSYNTIRKMEACMKSVMPRWMTSRKIISNFHPSGFKRRVFVTNKSAKLNK